MVYNGLYVFMKDLSSSWAMYGTCIILCRLYKDRKGGLEACVEVSLSR